MSAEIIVRCTRAAMLEGARVEPGTTHRVSAQLAAELVGSGKFQLAHEGDLAAVVAAVRTQVADALRRERAPAPELPAGPWMAWRA